jgi:hypothetical protein
VTEETDRLPDGFVASFEYIDPKTILEELRQKPARRSATIWAFQNEIRPSDLYCYLGARFGPPNGVRIPVHAGHQFRSMPGHDSGPCRATIPVDAGRGV